VGGWAPKSWKEAVVSQKYDFVYLNVPLEVTGSETLMDMVLDFWLEAVVAGGLLAGGSYYNVVAPGVCVSVRVSVHVCVCLCPSLLLSVSVFMSIPISLLCLSPSPLRSICVHVYVKEKVRTCGWC